MGEFDQRKILSPVRLRENVTEQAGVEKGTSLDTRKVFDKIADFCNQLPFAGKAITAPAARLTVSERHPYMKTVKTVEAVGLLGVMAYAHSTFAGTGIDKVSQNIELLKQDPSPATLLACSIDVAYTTANVAATYAQLHLGGRLVEHFMKTKDKGVPNLSEWGLSGNEVNYDLVAENLMTAIVNEDQGDIDIFFMVLPKEQKQRVMESVKAITAVVDETYSFQEIDEKISELERDIEKKSKVSYILDIVKNAHIRDLLEYKSPYTFKQKMQMLITTLGGQIGFTGWG